MVHNTVYLELGGYHRLADHIQSDFGIRNPASEHNLDGTALYWRAALQKAQGSHYASVGIIGFAPHAQSPPERRVGADDDYSDTGVDATYQFANGGQHTFNANTSYIHEEQHLYGAKALGNSSAVANDLNTFTIAGQYAYRQTYSLTVAYTERSGNPNPAAFRPAPWGGSANHTPDSQFYAVQVECIPFGKFSSFARPFLNMRFGLEYKFYTQFNGGDTNYDGYGHSAHDADTLFAFLWMAI
jgi:hypothetical protein